MFRQKPKPVDDIVLQILRANGLETPLLQRRLVNAWEDVVGETVARYTESKTIRNQTLWVKILNPAIRADLQMKKSSIVNALNTKVGAQIIVDLRIF